MYLNNIDFPNQILDAIQDRLNVKSDKRNMVNRHETDFAMDDRA